MSKLWSSCTTLASFNKSFTDRSLQSPCLLIFSIKNDKLVGFSLPQHGNSDKSCAVDRYVIKFPKNCGICSLASVHGLVYFSRDVGGLLIWNSTIRRFSILSRPERCWKYTQGFVGYDPIDDTYKALFMPSVPNPKPKKENSNLPRVLTLGRAKESWRFIKGSFEHVPFARGPCINGVLYYESCLLVNNVYGFMMSFHVRSEKLNMIQVPWKRRPGGDLLTYQGKLARVTWADDDDIFISLWVLKDAERHEWSFARFSLPFPLHDPIMQTTLVLIGATNAGEFVYLPTKVLSPFHVLYFDPLRNSFRRVIYQDIADEEFMRCNGLGDEVLQAFPNHIETLISL